MDGAVVLLMLAVLWIAAQSLGADKPVWNCAA